jgi:hypothetical protein
MKPVKSARKALVPKRLAPGKAEQKKFRAQEPEVLEGRIAPAVVVQVGVSGTGHLQAFDFGNPGDDLTITISGANYIVSNSLGITEGAGVVDDGNANTATIPIASVSDMLLTNLGAGTDMSSRSTSR